VAAVSGTLDSISITTVGMGNNTIAWAEARGSTSTNASDTAGTLEAQHVLVLRHNPHGRRYILEIGAHGHDLNLDTGVRQRKVRTGRFASYQSLQRTNGFGPKSHSGVSDMKAFRDGL
jgi:hypothetical protein